MSTPVQLKITKAGIESVFDADQRGLRVQLNRIVYSSANFESVNMDTRTQLSNIILESSIAVGGVSEDRQTLRFFSVINSPSELEIKSLGVYTDTNVLFAIASVPAGNLFKVYSGISFIASFGLAVSASTSSAINITTDQNAAMSMVLMNDHESALNPHPQYMAAVQRVEQIVEELQNDVGIISGRKVEDIGVGDLYLTTRHFADGDAVAAHKGYGRWGRFGDGHVLATQAEQNNTLAPSFFKTLRATGGAYTHKLTINEMPKHKHSTAPYDKFSARSSDAGDQNSGAHDWGNAYWEYSSLLNTEAKWNTATEKERGGDQPHNNVQPSIVIAAWERLPDDAPNYTLSVSKPVVLDTEQVTFTLVAGNVPVGTRIPYSITDEDGIVLGRSSSNFLVNSGGTAQVVFTVFNVSSLINKTITLTLLGGINISKSFIVPALTYLFEGQHTVTIEPGEVAIFDMYGAGGGGGGSVETYQFSIRPDGTNGGSASLTYDTKTFVAGGGGKGLGGVWIKQLFNVGSGRAMFNGEGGLGGQNLLATDAKFEVIYNKNGEDAVIGSRWDTQLGASGYVAKLRTSHGGNGAVGVGSERWAYGGGGGGGGNLKLRCVNNETTPITVQINVGTHGKGWSGATNKGDDGGIAAVILTKSAVNHVA